MKKFIHEIHRRSLWQVLGVYVVTGWVADPRLGQLIERIGLPAPR